MYCRHCGKQLRDGAKFCQHCGSPTVERKDVGSKPDTREKVSSGNGKGGAGSSGQAQMQGNLQSGGQSYAGGQGQVPGSQPYAGGQGQFQRNPYPGGQPRGNSYPGANVYPGGQPQGAAYPGSQPYPGRQPQPGPYRPGGGMPGAKHGIPRGYGPSHGGMQAAGAGIQGVGRAAHETAKLKLLALIAVALIAIVMMIYMIFLKKGTPEDTIAKMENALNNMDQEELLECFDDQINSLYSGALGLGDSLSGLPLGDLADLATGLGGFMSAAGLTPEFTLEVLDVEYTGDDTCVVQVNFIVTYMGETETETQYLPMALEGREWLVSASALGAIS